VLENKLKYLSGARGVNQASKNIKTDSAQIF